MLLKVSWQYNVPNLSNYGISNPSEIGKHEKIILSKPKEWTFNAVFLLAKTQVTDTIHGKGESLKGKYFDFIV